MADEAQLQLFALGVTSVLDSSKPEEYYARFSARNPHIYQLLVRIARQKLKSTGRKQLPFRLIWETLRGEFLEHVSTDDGYRLNNVLAPYYSREIMAREPDLAGVFQTRDRQRAA